MTQEHPLESPGYILVIESNAGSAAAIQRAFDSDFPAQLDIVPGIDDALTSIATRVPDVILTTTFLAPEDDMKLRDHLRRSAEMSHTQVVTLPQFIESAAPDAPTTPPSGPGAMLRLLGKRQPVAVRRCDARMLREQVQEYLEQAHALRRDVDDRQRCGLASGFAVDVGAVPPREPWPAVSASTAMVLANRSESRGLASAFSLPHDRRRASRRKAADFGDVWRIALPGGEGRVLDISPLGVLVETSTHLTPGRIVGLQLVGLDRTVPVTARLVRSEVAELRGPEVRYRVAAAFAREIDLNAPRPAVAHPPKVLADLLGRVLADANWASNGAPLRSSFETELARLLPVQEVRIRTVAIAGPRECESICFNIPRVGGSRLILQAIFEPRYQPTTVEVRLLKAAADLGAVVFSLAPLREPAAARGA